MFIGVDLAHPYVIEVNILNPGGLNTVYNLTGEDYSEEVIAKAIGRAASRREKETAALRTLGDVTGRR